MKKEKWYFPKYYPSFACKADACRNTCCSSWRIPVSKEEFHRLVTMECSRNLNRRIQNAFIVPEVVTDEVYRYISFNWLGQCPIQEKGLCYLHREKGEEFLPKICRLYPRSLKRIGNYNVACCSSSCERVVEILYDYDDLEIVTEQMEETPQVFYSISYDGFRQIRSFQKILQDRSTTLLQSIIDICKIINDEEFDRDYDSDEDPLSAAILLLKRFSESNHILGKIFDIVSERYGSDPSLYEKDRDAFEEAFPDWMTFFERVINNSMFYECFPFMDERADQTQVYKGLCICYGLLRLLCIANTYKDHKKDDLVDAVSSLFHLIDHTTFYYNVSLISGNAAIFLKL